MEDDDEGSEEQGDLPAANRQGVHSHHKRDDENANEVEGADVRAGAPAAGPRRAPGPHSTRDSVSGAGSPPYPRVDLLAAPVDHVVGPAGQEQVAILAEIAGAADHGTQRPARL